MPSLLPLSLCLTLAPLQIDLRHFDIAKPWSAVIHREYWVTFYNLKFWQLFLVLTALIRHRNPMHFSFLPLPLFIFVLPSLSLYLKLNLSIHVYLCLLSPLLCICFLTQQRPLSPCPLPWCQNTLPYPFLSFPLVPFLSFPATSFVFLSFPSILSLFLYFLLIFFTFLLLFFPFLSLLFPSCPSKSIPDSKCLEEHLFPYCGFIVDWSTITTYCIHLW